MAFNGKTASFQDLAVEVKEVPFKFVKEQIELHLHERACRGRSRSRLGLSMVFGPLQSYEDELERTALALSSEPVGVETAFSPLLTFILAMALYPEVQAFKDELARAEVEAVMSMVAESRSDSSRIHSRSGLDTTRQVLYMIGAHNIPAAARDMDMNPSERNACIRMGIGLVFAIYDQAASGPVGRTVTKAAQYTQIQ
ncbi:hypothetical protein BV22DRAFT_1048302 [Leucogyrophana mollusca]|uniref:Uncharacterized protein n=1 Tax=Leucogyrophana mollusca TaxID=85980 RepID=A0ACB8BC70_9AGAM|nr:hypothetical protein BV22DRAFT_1048302 [Leucogyrophana mollusca]